jgi:ribosomal protein S18 acetylase RimI-like enzyme
MDNLRKLQRSDFDEWLKLWNLYLEFYKHQLPEDVKLFTFERLINNNANMHCAVIERDGEMVGLVQYIFHASTWTKGYYCYLQDLYVLDKCRGQGIARKLIEHVYREADAAQCSRVYWLTHESNKTAIGLYEKVAEDAGFIQFRKNLPL